jgi:putative membrane protein
MNRILSCTAAVAFFAAAGCSGSNSRDQAKAPTVTPLAQSSISAYTTPAAVPSGPSSDQSPLAAVEPPSASSQSQANAAAANAAATTGAIGGGPVSPAVVLTDEQILQALHTANAGEIEQGKLAQQKSQDGDVKHFAGMMIKDHSNADKKGQDVAQKTQMTLASSSVSASLQSDAQQLTSGMSARTGADFDRSYIDAQVREHQAVLDMIDTQLLPNAKSPDVKKLVQAVRPKVESHLKEAQDIQRKLAGS